MPSPAIRHLVLDNAAASALLSPRKRDPRRKAVVDAIVAANGRRLVPTAVRGEAGWDRTAPGAANANRLLGAGADVALDGTAGNRVVQLRAAVPTASVVDATVAGAAEQAGQDGNVVEVLTSDLKDLRALAGSVDASLEITKI
jgi:hypothetical protein